ncbi:lymphoid-restricted membrane protein-like [Sphaeramia orbicularis]|uniref:lymphoid-restricted membrane protein-like n=1 Tax=Sphaeramia orbicularis TaxID=375764 RepID=UPI00117ED590|nr:lymphoid-restricted membrane protein-like [Sphaeramia orbicularis]
MSVQADAETNSFSLSTMAGSDDSDEETSQEEQPITSWNDLSIIERVGLNSVEMSEKDLETAFSQITLAFRCDQYTLKQRLQAEEHARNLAEENIQLELTRGRETLETLKALCLDSKRSKILQKLELSLDILGGTVERISNTAEVLGAVHQEARVSRAVELMVSHVENLRKRYDKNLTELKEARRMIQQQKSSRNIIYTRASPETEESSDSMNSSKQSSLRRRVSISVITNQTQMPSSSSSAPEKKKRDSKKKTSGGSSSSSKKSSTCPSPTHSSESSCSTMTKDDSCSVDDRPLVDPIETPSEAPPPPPPLDPAPIPKPECPPLKQVASRDAQNTNSPMDTLRQRHRSKATLSKKKAEREKKNPNIYRQLSAGTSGSLWKRPVTQWLYRCRWALLGVYLLVLLAVITLTYFLWKLNDAAPES